MNILSRLTWFSSFASIYTHFVKNILIRASEAIRTTFKNFIWYKFQSNILENSLFGFMLKWCQVNDTWPPTLWITNLYKTFKFYKRFNCFLRHFNIVNWIKDLKLFPVSISFVDNSCIDKTTSCINCIHFVKKGCYKSSAISGQIKEIKVLNLIPRWVDCCIGPRFMCITKGINIVVQ